MKDTIAVFGAALAATTLPLAAIYWILNHHEFTPAAILAVFIFVAWSVKHLTQ